MKVGKARMGVATTIAGAIVGVLAPSASAADKVDATADLVAAVAPNQGSVVSGAVTGGEIVAKADGAVATMPVDAGQRVSLAQGASRVEIALPAEVAVDAGEVSSDGSVVYQASNGGADAVVQALDDGSVRLQTVTPKSGPRDFTYMFGEGVFPVAVGDGSVELVQDLGDVAVTVGRVDSAWALDAAGRPVATEYRIEGDALVQVIEPSAATVFPVIADPKVTVSAWNTTVYFNKKETLIVGAGGAGLSVVLSKVPIAGFALSAVAAGVSSAAGIYSAQGKCLKIVAYGAPGVYALWLPQPYAGREAGRYCK